MVRFKKTCRSANGTGFLSRFRFCLAAALTTGLVLPAALGAADTTPPDTILDSVPPPVVTVNHVTYDFHGAPESDTQGVACKIDAGPFTDCTHPKNFFGLANGEHTAVFRAVDASANQDPTPATHTFTVDTSAKLGKVTIQGPARALKGKRVTYRVTVANRGGSVARGVKVKASGRGIAGSAGPVKVGAGKSARMRVRVTPGRTGKVMVTFRASSNNAGIRTGTRTLTVHE